MNRSLLVSIGLGVLFCGGLGTCSAIPAAMGLVRSLTSGYYSHLEPFVQGQMVGRVIGGPCVGLVCGAIGGAIIGTLLKSASKGGGGPA